VQAGGALPGSVLESMGTLPSAESATKDKGSIERRVDLWDCSVPLVFAGVPVPCSGEVSEDAVGQQGAWA
jgi:hypothetical protein